MACAFNQNLEPFNFISSKWLAGFPLNPPQSFSSGASSGGSVSSTSGSAQKRMEDGSARFTNANFQEVSTHAGGGAKDGPGADVKGAEGKNKKANSHCAPQRGRKSATGKPLGAVVTTATSSTSSCSPFQQSESQMALRSAITFSFLKIYFWAFLALLSGWSWHETGSSIIVFLAWGKLWDAREKRGMKCYHKGQRTLVLITLTVLLKSNQRPGCGRKLTRHYKFWNTSLSFYLFIFFCLFVLLRQKKKMFRHC